MVAETVPGARRTREALDRDCDRPDSISAAIVAAVGVAASGVSPLNCSVEPGAVDRFGPAVDGWASWVPAGAGIDPRSVLRTGTSRLSAGRLSRSVPGRLPVATGRPLALGLARRRLGPGLRTRGILAVARDDDELQERVLARGDSARRRRPRRPRRSGTGENGITRRTRSQRISSASSSSSRNAGRFECRSARRSTNAASSSSNPSVSITRRCSMTLR